MICNAGYMSDFTLWHHSPKIGLTTDMAVCMMHRAFESFLSNLLVSHLFEKIIPTITYVHLCFIQHRLIIWKCSFVV